MSERHLLARRVPPPRTCLRAILHSSWLYMHEQDDVRELLDGTDMEPDALAAHAREFERRIAERRASGERP